MSGVERKILQSKFKSNYYSPLLFFGGSAKYDRNLRISGFDVSGLNAGNGCDDIPKRKMLTTGIKKKTGTT